MRARVLLIVLGLVLLALAGCTFPHWQPCNKVGACEPHPAR